MANNKNHIFAIVGVIALLLIASVIWKPWNKNSQTNPTLQTETESANIAQEAKPESVKEAVPVNQSTTACNSSNQVEYLDCIFKSAIRNNNYSLCLNLANPTEDICLEQVGINTGNESVCARISQTQLRDACYRSVGIKKTNTDICRKISIREETDKCYLGIAKATSDTSLCFNVQTIELHNECLKIDPEHKKNLETN